MTIKLWFHNSKSFIRDSYFEITGAWLAIKVKCNSESAMRDSTTQRARRVRLALIKALREFLARKSGLRAAKRQRPNRLPKAPLFALFFTFLPRRPKRGQWWLWSSGSSPLANGEERRGREDTMSSAGGSLVILLILSRDSLSREFLVLNYSIIFKVTIKKWIEIRVKRLYS